jgi:hypothetical protein
VRLPCGDFLGKVTQGVAWGGARLHRGQLWVLVTLLGDELVADRSGAYTCIQTWGAELGLVVTLAINDSSDVIEERRPVHCGPLAPPSGKGLETNEATFEFMRAFSHGAPVPAQCAFGKALATWAEFLACARHKEPAGAALERLGRVDKQRLECVRQCHMYTSG